MTSVGLGAFGLDRMATGKESVIPVPWRDR
jgi:hypothetical protein